MKKKHKHEPRKKKENDEMKRITVVLDHEMQTEVMDVPDGITVRIIDTAVTSARKELANGKYGTVTDYPPDSEVLKDVGVDDGNPNCPLPARPDITYANQGWKGWAHLFGWELPEERESSD